MGVGHDHDGILRGLDGDTDAADARAALLQRVRYADGMAAHDRANARDDRAAFERALIRAQHAESRVTVLEAALKLSRAEVRVLDLRCTELRLALREACNQIADAQDDAAGYAALADLALTTNGEDGTNE